MTNDWIIDVIADLGSFARQNGYVSLSASLREAALVAAAELAQAGGRPADAAGQEDGPSGRGSRPLA
jgi:hypothetical protein